MRARSLLLAVFAIALCGCAAGSHLAAGMKNDPTAPVPWISATPTTMLLPTPSPTVIPAGTRPCQAADLQAVFGGIGALTGGQLGASILFGNRSASACVLEGVPAELGRHPSMPGGGSAGRLRRDRRPDRRPAWRLDPFWQPVRQRLRTRGCPRRARPAPVHARRRICRPSSEGSAP